MEHCIYATFPSEVNPATGYYWDVAVFLNEDGEEEETTLDFDWPKDEETGLPLNPVYDDFDPEDPEEEWPGDDPYTGYPWGVDPETGSYYEEDDYPTYSYDKTYDDPYGYEEAVDLNNPISEDPYLNNPVSNLIGEWSFSYTLEQFEYRTAAGMIKFNDDFTFSHRWNGYDYNDPACCWIYNAYPDFTLQF